jgi:hypothetical protein
MTGQAVTALSAGHVVGSKDPVAGLEISDPLAYFDNLAGDFVTQNQRGFLDAVPFHQIATANPARPDAHQQFSGRDLGTAISSGGRPDCSAAATRIIQRRVSVCVGPELLDAGLFGGVLGDFCNHPGCERTHSAQNFFVRTPDQCNTDARHCRGTFTAGTGKFPNRFVKLTMFAIIETLASRICF